MTDYTKYHPKAIRNIAAPSQDEDDYISMEANKAVDAILSRYHGEPEFQRRILLEMGDRILPKRRQESLPNE